MRAGQVVRIRVNPKDCMSAIDILAKAGVPTEGISFSAIVSLAFSAITEGLRKQGTIPDRDGFEYTQMMQPFLRGAQGSKLAIMDSIYKQGSEFSIAPVAVEQRETGPAQEPTMTTEQVRAGRMLSELDAKRELAAENPAVVFDAQDWQEFRRLYKIVYQEEWLG